MIDIGGGSTELIVGSGVRDRLPRLAAGRRRPPQRAPHLLRPADRRSSWRRWPTDVRGLIEAAVAGQPAARGRGRDRRRRHPDLAGGGRDGAGALRPGPGPRPPILSLPRDPAHALAPRLGPLAERVEIAGLHPDRAPTIVAGVVILIEAMRAFGLDQIEASEHDILYGAALAAPQPSSSPSTATRRSSSSSNSATPRRCSSWWRSSSSRRRGWPSGSCGGGGEQGESCGGGRANGDGRPGP